MRDEGPFCNVDETSSKLAVIGILSHWSNLPLRSTIRSSWLTEESRANSISTHGLDVRFVVRGIGAPAALYEEHRQRRDVVLLAAGHSLSRKRGPLQSLLLWLRCATAAWPLAQFIGKADDDLYLRLDGVARHLTASNDAVKVKVRRRLRLASTLREH